jgi:hypothetical protein
VPHGAGDITQNDEPEFAQWTPPVAQCKGHFATAAETAQHRAAEIELTPSGVPVAQGAPREQRRHKAFDFAVQMRQFIGRELPVNPDVSLMAIGLSGAGDIGRQRFL